MTLTDAQLAWFVGCKPKWLYNAARRTGHPIERTPEDARWWRLTHHLAQLLGITLARAAEGADTVLGLGLDSGRVRIGATPDDAVSVAVDIGRFHDCAALALAAAYEVIKPVRRGRPRKTPLPSTAARAAGAAPVVREAGETVRASLAELTRPGGTTDANGLVDALVGLDLDPILGGFVARRITGARTPVGPLTVHIRSPGRADGRLATLLNSLGGRPRGAWHRAAFAFDRTLVRSVPVLALDLGGLPVTLVRAPGRTVLHEDLRRTAVRVAAGATPLLIATEPDGLQGS